MDVGMTTSMPAFEAPRRSVDASLSDDMLDRLWSDPRAVDDRTQFEECSACGRPYRWLRNVGSQRASNMPIVARAVISGRLFDPSRHAGLVAVAADRTGFTTSRSTDPADVADTVLYRCHWDVCEAAAARRAELSHVRRGGERADVGGSVTDIDALHRYAQWRDTGGIV